MLFGPVSHVRSPSAGGPNKGRVASPPDRGSDGEPWRVEPRWSMGTRWRADARHVARRRRATLDPAEFQAQSVGLDGRSRGPGRRRTCDGAAAVSQESHIRLVSGAPQRRWRDIAHSSIPLNRPETSRKHGGCRDCRTVSIQEASHRKAMLQRSARQTPISVPRWTMDRSALLSVR